MNLCRSLPSLVLLAALMPPLTAGAQEYSGVTGWYVGSGLSLNDVYSYDNSCLGCYGSTNYGDHATGLTLTAGLRPTRHFAVEASWFGKSTMSWDDGLVFLDSPVDAYLVDADVELSSYQLNLLGILSGRLWDAYLRGGVAFWEADARQTLTGVASGAELGRTIRESGDDLTFGIGVGRRVGRDWQVRIDYAYFRIHDDLLGVTGNEKAYTDFLTLQIVRRLGSW